MIQYEIKTPKYEAPQIRDLANNAQSIESHYQDENMPINEGLFAVQQGQDQIEKTSNTRLNDRLINGNEQNLLMKIIVKIFIHKYLNY